MNNNKFEEIKKKMLDIINLLNEWNNDYYQMDKSIVEDFVYDEKMRELYNLEKENNFFFDFSPTRNVGIKNSSIFLNNTEIRKKKMLSLESINYDINLLKKFNEKIKKKLKKERIEYICEWKIDGLSVSIIYENHVIKQISTRGDGEVGEDVTINKWMIVDLPLFLPKVSNCEIRGEVYMKKDNFEKLNEHLKKNGRKEMANLRNAASGSLRNSFYSSKRILNFFAYQIFLKENELNNQSECLSFLEKNNFNISPNHEVYNDIERIWENLEKKKKERENLEFETDGIVIKVNKYVYHEELGENNKFPRWAIAVKFPSPISKSFIKRIEINLSRTGRINYIAKINPIEIQGSIIKNVSLHNFNFIKKMKINEGDEIFIKKAGDVIPQIIEVIKKNKNNESWNFPKICPFCSKELIWGENFTYQICNNDECEERNIKNIIHFSSKEGLNIKWISENTIKDLFNKKLIKYPYDLLYLPEKKEEMLKMNNFRIKKVEKIIDSIENAKKKPLFHFISSLGIVNFSTLKAKKMMNFLNEEEFINMIEKNDWKKIKNLFGEKMEENFRNYFAINSNKDTLKKIIDIIN